jgi:hypothetical protein
MGVAQSNLPVLFFLPRLLKSPAMLLEKMRGEEYDYRAEGERDGEDAAPTNL